MRTLRPLHGIVSTLLAGLFLVWSAPAQIPAGGSWKCDKLQLKSGNVFHGLIAEETPTEVRFYEVRQKAGRPTVVVFTTFARREVESIVKLDDHERRRLTQRLKDLDPTGKEEDLRVKSLDMKPALFGEGDVKKEGLSYSSDHFVLVSNAREEIVRRAAVRLEQIYAAYTHFLPPRRRPMKSNGEGPSQHKTTTTILLVQSQADYRALLRSQGRDILNPAFYDAERNEVVCASELEQLGAKLDEMHKVHEQKLERIRKQEGEAKKLPGGEVRERVFKQLDDARKEIALVNTKNEEVFREATQQLFQTLYHEAFHAYLANFVYPPGTGDVPRWMNEGLAQVFETAIIEAGELRVGHADPVRLLRVKKALAATQKEYALVPLADLLKARPQDFVVAHASARQVADRHYLTSWGLAHYLTFQRRLLGSKALEKYLQALGREGDPLATFQVLVGQPLADFEKEFHSYLQHLQADGTTAKN
ncbi:MAG: DUF1570 domain-containing protein [Gemmataceae bacterium]|nr:DUF1570 domain-containing protein [Gemmataceae bacterium]